MSKLIKKHQGGNVIESFTKSKAYNSLPATAIKIFDPTGISSYGDVYNAWTDGKFDYNDVLEPLGAVPVLGKLGKVGKYLGKGIKGLNELSDAKKILDAGKTVNTSRKIGAGGRSFKTSFQSNYISPFSVGEIREATRTLNNNKLANRLQYGVRAGANIDDILDVQNAAGNTLSLLRK